MYSLQIATGDWEWTRLSFSRSRWTLFWRHWRLNQLCSQANRSAYAVLLRAGFLTTLRWNASAIIALRIFRAEHNYSTELEPRKFWFYNFCCSVRSSFSWVFSVLFIVCFEVFSVVSFAIRLLFLDEKICLSWRAIYYAPSFVSHLPLTVAFWYGLTRWQNSLLFMLGHRESSPYWPITQSCHTVSKTD